MKAIGFVIIGLAFIGVVYGGSYAQSSTSQQQQAPSIYASQDSDPYLRMVTYKKDLNFMNGRLKEEFEKLQARLDKLEKK